MLFHISRVKNFTCNMILSCVNLAGHKIFIINFVRIFRKIRETETVKRIGGAYVFVLYFALPVDRRKRNFLFPFISHRFIFFLFLFITRLPVFSPVTVNHLGLFHRSQHAMRKRSRNNVS